MTKQEFIREWSKIREQKIREIYKGEPSGPACAAMSIMEIPEQAEKLWRKYRSALKTETVDKFMARFTKES